MFSTLSPSPLTGPLSLLTPREPSPVERMALELARVALESAQQQHRQRALSLGLPPDASLFAIEAAEQMQCLTRQAMENAERHEREQRAALMPGNPFPGAESFSGCREALLGVQPPKPHAQITVHLHLH